MPIVPSAYCRSVLARRMARQGLAGTISFISHLTSSRNTLDPTKLLCLTLKMNLRNSMRSPCSTTLPECFYPLPPSWSMPTLDEARDLHDGVHAPKWRYSSAHHPFSAASVAIRVLESLPDSTRAHIRQIVLVEDEESIANSPSHAQGLIPYCRENRSLHVKRIVNLRTTGFGPKSQGINNCGVPARTVTKSIGRWILETIELKNHGMPEGSFQLVMDGEPLLEKATEIFNVVQRDVCLPICA